MRLNDDQLPVQEDGSVDYIRFASVVAKIARSFLYFVMEFCYIENKTESGQYLGESKFNLWPAQRPVTALFLKHRLLAILKARQLGLTWLTAAYCLWCCLTRRGFLAVVISANEDWAKEFLDRVRFMYVRLPSWLQRDLSRDGSEHMRFVFEWDKDGKKSLVTSDIKSLTTTPAGAQSKTPDLLVMDETARNRYASEIYGASKPGIDKAGGQIIVISNAHKRGPGWPWTRSLCSGALKGENTFHLLFMPWWDCPERLTANEIKKLDENQNFVPTEFKALQIREGVAPEDVSENYPDTVQEALESSSGSYFGDALQRHSQFQTKSNFKPLAGMLFRDKENQIYLDVDENTPPNRSSVFRLWRYPYFLTSSWDGNYWSDRYVIGSDISEGQGRSYSVAYVLDRRLDELVCKIRANRIDAVDWSRYLWVLSQYYCNFHISGNGRTFDREPAMICVERTGAGITTVGELEKVNANQFVRTLAGKVGDGITKDIGWHEDAQSKHELCSQLRNWFKTCRGLVYCDTLISEASTTIEHENGRLGPEQGEMWDCVVAAGCAIQASLQLGGPPQIVKPVDNNYGGGRVSNWGI